MDTLAVRLTVPPVGSVEDFPDLTSQGHLLAGAPCRAHQEKRLQEGTRQETRRSQAGRREHRAGSTKHEQPQGGLPQHRSIL